jgi:hypothetical protein
MTKQRRPYGELKPLGDDELADFHLLFTSQPGNVTIPAELASWLVAEVIRLRMIERETRLALRAALSEVIVDERLAHAQTADLVRRLAKARAKGA